MSVVPRDDSLSIDDKRKIDQICTRFEEEWLAGQRPVLEQFVQQIHPAAQAVLLGELLLLELDYRRSLKERCAPEEYLQRFPRLRAVIGAAFDSAKDRAVPIRFLPGTKIGRYEVRNTLGSGAFAVVYLAWDKQLQRDVAVKIPHRFLLANPAARKRFLSEARTVARLRHPGIVALYDVAELPDDETIYLVMQYIPGESLRRRLAVGPLPPQQAGDIAAKVADAIAAAHCAGIFHRDLTPSNILLDEQGDPCVCDFGLALHADDQRERRGECAGTLAYMAPEQIRGEAHHLDGRADIWALGVIHYEMLTGQAPFSGRHRHEVLEEILHRDPRPPRQLDTNIGRDQERVCLRCLAKTPSERFATAGDVAEALRAAGRPHRFSRWSLFVAAVVAICGLGIALGWLGSHRDEPRKSALLPLGATLDVRVWGMQSPYRQGVKAVEPVALPLRNGDRVRVRVQLNQPAYIYVVWLDAAGTVAPVYPWTRGQWDQRPAQEKPRIDLALPGRQDRGWLVRVEKDGLESLLLLARRSPLPQEVNLRDLLADVGHSSLEKTAAAFEFHGGRPHLSREAAKPSTQRPLDLGHAVRIPDPVLQMQRRTAEVLQPHFELIRAVSLPVQGE